MNGEFAFVLLNYNGSEVTEKCVESLKEKMDEQCAIFIVDNASPDGSGTKLQTLYARDKTVAVLHNQENVGFSRGLNVGFQYAKQAGYRYISLINNDTILLSDHFSKICREDFDRYHCAVIGPHIDNCDDNSVNVNPNAGACNTVERMQTLLMWQKHHLPFRIALAEAHLLGTYMSIRKQLARMVKRTGASEERTNENQNIEKIVTDCGLHGSFLIFTPLYVDQFNGLLEVTFAYYEEWLLYQLCKKNGMTMMYDPRIRIFHAEHTVMKTWSGDEMKRYAFRARMELDAARNVLRYIELNS